MDILTSKQRRLLQLLSTQEGFIRGQELAARLGVTDRTIRSDVAQMEPALRAINARIESVRGKGYQLHAENSAELRTLLYGDGSLVSQDDRMHVILERLVFAEKPMALGDLQDELYVSHTTLENDLRRIRALFSDTPPNMNIVRSDNHIELRESEQRRRFLLRYLFTEDWDYNSDDGLHHRNTFLDPDEFDQISTAVKETLTGAHVTINDHGLVGLVLAAAIAASRIRTGHTLQEQEIPEDAAVHRTAEELCDRLEQELGVTFNVYERRHLAEQLAQEHMHNLQNMRRKNVEHLIEPKIAELVHDYLEYLREHYCLDLTDDEQLWVQLAICLQTSTKVPYVGYSELAVMLRESDPYVFELAVQVVPFFMSRFSARLREAELGEVAGYLAAAIERLAIFARRIPVAVASHKSYSNSSYLMARLSAFFGNRIELRGPYSVYDRQALLESGCPLILTTTRTDLIRSPSQRVCPISVELPEKEIFALHGILQELRGDVLYGVPQRAIEEFFDPDFFELHTEAESRGAALQQMCGRLERAGVIGEDFYGEVILREALSSTAFEPGFAVPHAIIAPAKRTVISVTLLEKPILWNGARVSYICLCTFRPDERPLLFRICNDLRERFSRPQAWKKLNAVRNYEQFIRLILE